MTDDWDIYSVPGQGIVRTHGTALCRGRPCCVHDPSDHHMRDWPLTFDMERAALGVRTCPHGLTHPDPDSIAYFYGTALHPNQLARLLLHACDDCCL